MRRLSADPDGACISVPSDASRPLGAVVPRLYGAAPTVRTASATRMIPAGAPPETERRTRCAAGKRGPRPAESGPERPRSVAASNADLHAQLDTGQVTGKRPRIQPSGEGDNDVLRYRKRSRTLMGSFRPGADLPRSVIYTRAGYRRCGRRRFVVPVTTFAFNHILSTEY